MESFSVLWSWNGNVKSNLTFFFLIPLHGDARRKLDSEIYCMRNEPSSVLIPILFNNYLRNKNDFTFLKNSGILWLWAW